LNSNKSQLKNLPLKLSFRRVDGDELDIDLSGGEERQRKFEQRRGNNEDSGRKKRIRFLDAMEI
jgi:hypothetical protein